MSNHIREIFVFGSNLAGLHGAGSAKAAFKFHGARMGQGVGWCGNSYAIPTKTRNLDVMELEDITCHVHNFLKFATRHPDWKFNVVAIGTGLAGFKPHEIGPMFIESPDNVNLPTEFKEYV